MGSERAKNPRRTNWDQVSIEVRSALSEVPWSIRDGHTLEMASRIFRKAITSTYQGNCWPTRVRKTRETFWWNKKLNELCRKTRERSRRPSTGKTDELRIWLTMIRDEYSGAIREAKQELWSNYFTDIEKGAEADRLDKLLSRELDAILCTLQLPDGGYSASDKETLDHLIKAHFRSLIRSEEKPLVANWVQNDE